MPPGASRPADQRALHPLRLSFGVLLLLLTACSGNKSVGVIDAANVVYDVPARAGGDAVEPVALKPGRGSLVLHGGGRFGRDTAAVIVASAGPDPRLCLIDTADVEQGAIYSPFDGFAGVKLTVLDLERADVARPDVLAALKSCTGYFFGGGAPQRLSEVFRPNGRDSPALAVIRERFARDGTVVAGSSAGAMIVGPLTLCECGQKSSVLAVTQGELFKAPGFDFLAAPILVDAHFFARGLLGRHMFALARDRIPVGVGIDEDTTIYVPGDGGPWRILGGRSVALVRLPKDATVDRLQNFGFSKLYAGDRFDPATGDVWVAENRTQATRIVTMKLKRKKGTAEPSPISYSYQDTATTKHYAASDSGTIETTLNRLVSVGPL